ncbi:MULTISPECIES: glycosyltransferase family 4 protein [Flavobacteriaceae]|uniref:Glycosyltransferase n=2 Tax=Flavobacteriaceae TaxID=49546 RepID=A0A4Y8AWR6_9FLAO|nr:MULTISPECIES: glycosyltransferase [Flavobacteriaceae]TEW76585.1 glycosyltransferase [Gramella jeungdoensis]GGK51759.1 hypothetical protein GCM10007963_20170 [Lutibacter litoralis]
MKIGLVLSATPSYSETFFNSKIKGLQENDFEVVLFVQHKSPSFKLCPVYKSPKVFKNPMLQFFSMLVVFLKLVPNSKTIIRYMRLERRDNNSWFQIVKKIYLNAHILSQKLNWLHFGFATMALGKENVAKSIDAKMGVSFRGFDLAIYPLKHPNCYNLLWKRLDKVHTISNDLLNIAYSLGLSKNMNVEKITPAIDIEFFKNEDKNIKPNQHKLQILTVGRLHWKKGIVATLEALAKLKDENIDFTYSIVGMGEDYERIAYAIVDLKLTNHVKLFGKKSRNELIQIYKKSDIYIQYSISEGFCNSVIEAQAMGPLCIVSNAEGLTENIENNKTGWLVNSLEAPTLALKIIEVLNLNEQEKEMIRSNARERVLNYFSLEKQKEAFKSFYS